MAGGPLGEVLEGLDFDPLGRFEAGVVFTARVTGHDPEYRLTRLVHHGQRITIPMVDVAVGSEARLRVRSRDISLATRRPECISVRNVLSASVVAVMEEADTALAEVLVDIGAARLRVRITREAVAEPALAPGARVYALIKVIAFDWRALSVLPALPSGSGRSTSSNLRAPAPNSE